MEDFCHGSKAIKRFMYSVKLLPVKMDRAVFICDVCVRVCGLVIEIFAVGSFGIYPATPERIRIPSSALLQET